MKRKRRGTKWGGHGLLYDTVWKFHSRESETEQHQDNLPSSWTGTRTVRSSGMWRHVVLLKFTDADTVLSRYTASVTLQSSYSASWEFRIHFLRESSPAQPLRRWSEDSHVTNWRKRGRKQSWRNVRYYPGICLEGLGKQRKISGWQTSRQRLEQGTISNIRERGTTTFWANLLIHLQSPYSTSTSRSYTASAVDTGS
jgi:hypothetical protein